MASPSDKVNTGKVKAVGIVSAGDMGSGIGSVLTNGGMEVVTSLDGRGDLTRLRAGEAGMRDVGSLDAVVAACLLLVGVLLRVFGNLHFRRVDQNERQETSRAPWDKRLPCCDRFYAGW